MVKRLVKAVSVCLSVLLSSNVLADTIYGMKRLVHIISAFLILAILCSSNIHASDGDSSSSTSTINARPTSEMGTLIVRRWDSRHSGNDRVYIDGIFRGSTRLEIELPQGKHTIRVEQDGFKFDEWTLDLDEHEVEWAILKSEKKKELPTTTAGMLELEFWKSVKDSDNPTLIQEYLRQFPNGLYSVLAKLKLEAMIGNGSSPTDRSIPNLNYGSYYALVIGNNRYEHFPSLKTAVNDARAVANVLESNYRFSVDLLENATRSEMIIAITKLQNKVDLDDNVLVYYAGHGLIDPHTDQGFWIPVDASLDNESNWLLVNRVRAHIKALPAKHVLVIADSCFSGKLSRSSLTRGFTHDQELSENLPELKRLVHKRSRTVLTSGGLEPVLDSIGTSKHSVFAQAFLSILRSNNNVIIAGRLFYMLRSKVISNSLQTPEYGPIYGGGHDGGDFVFVRR